MRDVLRSPGPMPCRMPNSVMVALFAFAWLGSTASASVLDWIFPKRDVQVIAVTDTTPAGALRRPVTPANPVYYAAVSAGYRDFGGIIAGEKVPPKEEVLKTIARVLAKQETPCVSA